MKKETFQYWWKSYRQIRNGRQQFVTLIAATGSVSLCEFARLCLETGKSLRTAIQLSVIFATILGNGRELEGVAQMIRVEYVDTGRFTQNELAEAILNPRRISDAWKGWMLQAAGLAD